MPDSVHRSAAVRINLARGCQPGKKLHRLSCSFATLIHGRDTRIGFPIVFARHSWSSLVLLASLTDYHNLVVLSKDLNCEQWVGSKRQYHDGIDDFGISDAADIIGQSPEQDADDDRAPQLSKTEEQTESPILDHLRGPRPHRLF